MASVTPCRGVCHFLRHCDKTPSRSNSQWRGLSLTQDLRGHQSTTVGKPQQLKGTVRELQQLKGTVGKSQLLKAAVSGACGVVFPHLSTPGSTVSEQKPEGLCTPLPTAPVSSTKIPSLGGSTTPSKHHRLLRIKSPNTRACGEPFTLNPKWHLSGSASLSKAPFS